MFMITLFTYKYPYYTGYGQAVTCLLSHFSSVQLFATLWTRAHLAPLSMRFSRHKYKTGLPCPVPRVLPNPGIKPTSFMSLSLADGFFTIWDTQAVTY